MGETARRHSERLRQGEGVGTDRLVFFSDAVFAIAITLLVIDLSVRTADSAGRELPTSVIATEMLAAWPGYLAYVISFAVIGVNWATHHRTMSQLRRWDTSLLLLNLLLLLFIAFLPFPTRMLFPGEGGITSVQFTFYAGTVLAIGIMQALLWVAAKRRDLLLRDIDDQLWRYELVQILASPLVFAASFAVEFTVGSPWSLYAWMLQMPVAAVLARYEPRKRPETAALSRNPG